MPDKPPKRIYALTQFDSQHLLQIATLNSSRNQFIAFITPEHGISYQSIRQTML